MLLFSFSLFLSLFLFIYLFIFALGKREGGEEEEEKHIENRKIGKEGRKRKTWRRRRRRKRKIIDTVFSHGFWGWSIIRPFGCPPPHLSGGFPLSLPPSSLLLPSLPLPLHLLGFHSFISFYMYLFICLFYTFSWGPGKHTPFYLNGDWIEWSSPAAMIGVSISRESHGASGIRILKVSPTPPTPPPPPPPAFGPISGVAADWPSCYGVSDLFPGGLTFLLGAICASCASPPIRRRSHWRRLMVHIGQFLSLSLSLLPLSFLSSLFSFFSLSLSLLRNIIRGF